MDFVFSQSMDQKLNLNHTQILSLKLLAMNSYDLENYLNYAKKYDLKLNLIWYGSFVDGETLSFR